MAIELKVGVMGHNIAAKVCWDHQGVPLADAVDGNLGLLASDLRQHVIRGHSTAIAQFYGLLSTGMESTQHIFQGLQRPLRTDGNNAGDVEKFIYSRKPSFDFIWEGTKYEGTPRRRLAPPSTVFVVYVSANIKHRADFPNIDGWINHWTWVQEDSVLSQAPIGWVERYDRRIWTRT